MRPARLFAPFALPAVLVLLLLSAPPLPGGGKPDPSKVTRANYEKLKVNMELPEVERLLGKGKEVRSGGGFATYEWRGQQKVRISIRFRIHFAGEADEYLTLLQKDITD
jgi:hypothetical protein